MNLAALSTDGKGTVTSTVFGGRQILGGFVGNHGRGTELVPLRSHKDQFGVRAVPFSTLGPLADSDGPRGGHR
jgi:hypothetical protein